MKTVMILAMCLKVCNVRLFPIGMRLTRGTCVAMAALVSLLMTGALQADTHYVNVVRPDDSGDGLSWPTAEKTIQAAINASTAGDTIVVTNGVYASITTTNNSITIQSVNGAAVTIIDGGRTARCATLGSSPSHTNTVLVGLTLRNGSASSGGVSNSATLNASTLLGTAGGGSYCGTLNNCTLKGNSAYYGGGGSCYGTLNACTLSGNSASSGGGSYHGTLNNCTLEGNSASIDGGGSYYGTLNNCALTRNSASHDGGGASYGTLNNCTLTGNTTCYGGGARFSKLNNCTLTGNSATNGGGSENATLNNCTLTRNSATSDGGGSWYCTQNNCTFSGNSASRYGGGSYGGTLNNCMLTGNSATSGGGAHNATLDNCTLTGNSASREGGGSYNGTLNNCIIWENKSSLGSTDNYWHGTLRYSCTTPLPLGTGNLSADPLFRLSAAGDFRLSPGSPCLNAGTNGYAVGSMDVLGNPRIQDGTVDMGACEGVWTLTNDAPHLARNVSMVVGTNGVSVSWDSPSAGGASLYRVCRMNTDTGKWKPVSDWIAESSFLDSQVFGGVIYRYAIVSAFDARLDIVSGLSASAEGQRTMIPQVYVDASRPDDAGDGQSWTMAKKSIQAAIDIAAPYDTILVTNGVYESISTANKAITIQSVNGMVVTVIDGGGTNRCATLGSASTHVNTILVGFTLRNGFASSGGGSYWGTLNNCTLSGNSASTNGGGSCYGTLNNCTLTGNSATSGGGSYYGTLNNCTLTRNSASSSGGGALSVTLNNCTLTGNSASYGGGSSLGTLNNCTLAGNSAFSGGGSHDGTLNNCIAWGNTLISGVTNNYSGSIFSYSCTTPLPSGTGNLSSDPMFRLPAAGDFRLSPGSPCLNAGTNGYAVGTVDVLGNPRIQDGTVDMGTYEGSWTLATDAPHHARNVSATGGVDGVALSWQIPSAGGAVLYRVCRMDMVTARWTPVSDWITESSFLDTRFFGGVTYRYAIVSAFDARLDIISGLSAPVEGQRTLPQFYVDAARPSDAGDGRSWAKAKRSIQAAICVSASYDTILVTNGVYAPISTANKSITIRSVNGAAVTIIDGEGTNRCATLGSTSSQLNSILVGFTLRNGLASSGGGSYKGTLDNCTLTGNRASSSGGGACYGTLNNCTLSGNSAYEGGGAHDSTLNNCTLTGNSASREGGGSYYGTLNNCIVWGNTALGFSYNYKSGTFRYSCTMPRPPGTGNRAVAPLFRLPAAGDFRLSPRSPCLNAGTNCYVVGVMDGFGNPRIQDGTVDIGAYEGAGTLATNVSCLAQNVLAVGGADGIAVSWSPPLDGGTALYRVCRLDMATGQWTPVSGWISELTFLDTQVFGGVVYRYAIITAFDARLDVISGLSATAEGQRALPQFYVDAARPDDTGDGRSWATAKRDIQAAIDASASYDTIFVTNGVYAPISTANKAITIRSVNGAAVTIIDGGGTNRCATLGSNPSHVNTLLAGFTLRNGSASNGGGSYGGRLNNCTLTGNSASTSGGGSYDGTLNNCTLSGNSASSYGGGSYYGTLNNCIVWGNTLFSGEMNNYTGCIFSYSCTSPLPSGTRNISINPLFRLPAAGDFRLLPGSPCLNAGTNGYVVGAMEGLGNPRIQAGTVDMGACEGAWTLVTDAQHLARNVSTAGGTSGVTVSWNSPSGGGAVLCRVCRMDRVTGRWTPVSDWITESSFLDTRLFGGVTYHYAIVSAFDTRLDIISGLSAPAEGQRTLPQFYVDAARPNDTGDGRSWLTAKKTIQAAINVSTPYDTIFVTNGVYAPISTTNKMIAIQSVNGATVTIIDGGGMNRCATLGSTSAHLNSILVGFTLSNGSASDGGGAYAGRLNNCTLTGNSASSSGGGSYYGTLNNCTLTRNTAYDGGGGAYDGRLNNCTLTGNSATFGGGSYNGTLNNCTLSGNSAYPSSGCGSFNGWLTNCIVWGNTHISGVTNNYSNSTFSYSCTAPLPSGAGNISDDPLFKDAASSNFLLRVGSPCINAGSNTFVVGATDLAGNPRIQNGTVDMGAYEMLSIAVTLDWQNGSDVTLTNVLYGQAYQLPPAVFADATFLGWWTLPNGMGTAILPETVVSVTTNHTLYAQWDVNSVVGSTGLVWQTEGDSLWLVQTNAVKQGLSAMRSGVISDNQMSWIGTSVTGKGSFSFWWRVSSEGGYYELAFAVDGVQNRVISGTKKGEWQFVDVAFTNAGAHELRWTYSKNDSVSAGLDCGWLDRVAWIPARPIIPGNPNFSSNILDNVTQAQVDALVRGLRAVHPDGTDAEIAKKFEDADLFGFTGAALVAVGTDALARFNPSILFVTLSVVESDPWTLGVTLTSTRPLLQRWPGLGRRSTAV